MAFNWFISVIQLQFDLIQTSGVCDPPPTKDTATSNKWHLREEEVGAGDAEGPEEGTRGGGRSENKAPGIPELSVYVQSRVLGVSLGTQWLAIPRIPGTTRVPSRVCHLPGSFADP